MFKSILLLAIIVCSNAQILRFNPLTIGSKQLGAQQVIQLAAGGGLRPIRLAARAPLIARPLAIQSPYALGAAPLLARQVLSAPLIAARDEAPEPYTYAFQSADEYGTTLNRQETGDGSGAVTGSYGYTDAQGLTRLVEYVADAAGYRAVVNTNEPGTANANPADVLIRSTASRRR